MIETLLRLGLKKESLYLIVNYRQLQMPIGQIFQVKEFRVYHFLLNQPKLIGEEIKSLVTIMFRELAYSNKQTCKILFKTQAKETL
jgi:hypothetical protein